MAMVAEYLRAERDLGRIAPDADLDTIGLTLTGSGHLLFAGRDGVPPDLDAVRAMVDSVLAGVLPTPTTPAASATPQPVAGSQRPQQTGGQ
jgi:hypothetical protein